MDLCVRRGYLSKDGELVAHPELDPLFQDHDALALATTSSINGRIAFGPNASWRSRRPGSRGWCIHSTLLLVRVD